MDDVDGLDIKKEMIAMELEQCEDPDILDIIYKLLTYGEI